MKEVPGRIRDSVHQEVPQEESVNQVTASQESATSYQELPAKCWKSLEKLDNLAYMKKELSRLLLFNARTSLYEVFFDDHI